MPKRRAAAAAIVWATAWLGGLTGGAVSAAPAPGGNATETLPAPGDYTARWCVTTAAGAPANCGPAEVLWRSGGRARVRIDDIVYHLVLHDDHQLDVLLMHGFVQIDEFSAGFDWAGPGALRFNDSERGARYELRLGERKREARRAPAAK